MRFAIMELILKHKTISLLIVLLAALAAFVAYNTYRRATSKPIVLEKSLLEKVATSTYERIVVAGGCFWCTESEYDHVSGVISAVSGYAGTEQDYPEGSGPTYFEVSDGKVKARESVQVIYDPKIISTDAILEKYFRHIDPTDGSGQFADRGYQYTPAIYYSNTEQKEKAEALIKKIDASKKFAGAVAVLVEPFKNFYPAEEYHQHYKDKNPVRYAAYREGSGRNSFIRKYWQEDDTLAKQIFSTTQSTTTMKQPNFWKQFTAEDKEARLKELTSLQYDVTQKEGTERAFDNEYNSNKEKGIYVDIVSGEPLYLSTDKYDSGTGWPSFVKPISMDDVTLHEDKKLFSTRVEVRSKIADSHLGHVFDDGPVDSGGKRYCMNSAALRFVPLADMEKEGYGDYVKLLK